MHPDLEKLIVLQRYDVEAKRLRDEMEALPKLVAGLAAKLKTVEGQRAVVVDLLAKEEALRRRQESDIKDHQAKMARVRKQMDLATTTVQVTAYEHELAFAAAEVSRLEDLELASMERTEEMEGQRARADEAVAAAASLLERERVRAAETIARGKVELATIDGRRGALRPGIGEVALATYDRVVKGKGTGLAEGVHQKCSACQMLVRPQKWNDLRDRSNDETMMTCESCGRLLYWDPARDAPQKKGAEREESIAARIVRSL
jgi:predicted  nucleic acid-binding Zn-ribbon protein